MVKSDKATIVLVVVTVIGIFISTTLSLLYYNGFFTNADVRFVRQIGRDSVCPWVPSSSDGFEIFFRNEGNKGTDLFVDLSSSDNITFVKNNDSISLAAGESNSLKFKINLVPTS